MTTDIEHELRALLHDKAAGAPTTIPTTPAAAPQEILRRGRVHQIGTVVATALLAGILVVGSVAGLQALLGGSDFETGPPGYDVFERTAQVEAFTTTSPSDWFLVNEWPLATQIAVSAGSNSASGSGSCTVDAAGTQSCSQTSEPQQEAVPVPHGLPMLQLSNVDLGLDPACGAPIQETAAVLSIQYTGSHIIDSNPYGTWPGSVRRDLTDAPCGSGVYRDFTVQGWVFFAWIGFGGNVSERDRAEMMDALDKMTVADTWQPTTPDEATPGYVIAGGVAPGGPWRLELRPSGSNVRVSLEGVAPSESAEDFSVPADPIESNPCCAAPVTFGAVSKVTTGVEFRPSDGADPIPGRIVPLPPSLPFDFDVFFIEGTLGLRGKAVALGLEHAPTPPPPIGEPRSDVVELSGNFESQTWSVRFTGAFADGTECMDLTVAGASTVLCPTDDALRGSQPYLHGYDGEGLHLLAGSVPVEVASIRFTSDGGTRRPAIGGCDTGPAGWTAPDKDVCAIALPAEDAGTLQYLDAEGNVLFEEGMGWGSATASPGPAALPTPVQPTHGGTYWAAYAWVGAPGDPQAADVSQMLLDRYGIEAFPGDLACDQGAAEALGTNSEQGVAVYFETQRDATLFAKRAGIIDERGALRIAKVTTLCFD